MDVKLKYGCGYKVLEFPDGADVTVMKPRDLPVLGIWAAPWATPWTIPSARPGWRSGPGRPASPSPCPTRPGPPP
jgi:hypothetical protein